MRLSISIMSISGVLAAVFCALGCGSNEHSPENTVSTRQALCDTWTPACLQLSAWYEAAPQFVTLRDGGVETWSDRSGNGRDATQSFYGGRPAFDPAGWNGVDQGTLEFSGGNLMTVDSWPDAPAGANQPFTILAVLRSTSTQPQDAAIAGWWGPAGYVWADLKASNGQQLLDLIRTYSLGESQIYTGPGDLGNDRHAVAWRYSPSDQTIKLTVDGLTTSSTSMPPIFDPGPLPLIIGAKSTLPTGLFQGDLAELVITPSTLADDDIQKFTSYARNKWSNIAAPSSINPCIDAGGQPASSDVRCDDGNDLTYGDHCSAGTCVGTAPRAGSPGELGPIAWYHAGSSEVSLTDGRVSSWFDRTSNHRDLMQGFYNGRPLLVTDGWNGKPTIRFSGIDLLRREAWTGAPGSDAFTLLAVMRSAAPSQDATLLGFSNQYAYGQVSARLKNVEGGSVLDLLRVDDYGQPQEFNGDRAIGTDGHAVVFRYSPDAMKLTVDGVTVTMPQPGPIGSISPTEILLGNRNDVANEFFNGDISEFAIVPGSICDGQVANFVTYAASEWGGITPAASMPGGCGTSVRTRLVDPPDCPFGVPSIAFGRNGHDPLKLIGSDNTDRVLSWFGFNPQGSFANDWDAGVAASAMAYGDFDGDGKQELAVGRSPHDGGRLLIYDDAQTNYAELANLFTDWGSGFGVTAVATGDIDNDGLDEIAVARNESGNGGPEVFLIDDAKHDFAPMGQWDVGDRTVHALAFGDADNDQHLELLAARDGHSGSTAGRIFMIQDASHHYAVSDFASWGDSDRGATAVAVGDLDGDGIHEIAVGRNAGDNGRVLIYRYDAQAGTFDAIADFDNGWGSDRAVTALAFGDLAGNNKDQLVVGRNGGGGPRLFVYDSPISDLTPRELVEMGNGWGDDRAVSSLAVADVDDDGRDEILVGRSAGSGPRVLVFNDALDNFREMQDFGEEWGDDREASSIAVGKSLLCESEPAPSIPDDVNAADLGFEARRNEFIRYWIGPSFTRALEGTGGVVNSDTARSVFGDWGDDTTGDKHAVLKRIMASAAAIHFGLPEAQHLLDLNLPDFINRYLEDNIWMTNDVGTDRQNLVGGGMKRDFDFILVQLVEAAYFLEPLTDPRTGAPMVSDEALQRLLLVQTILDFENLWFMKSPFPTEFLPTHFGGDLSDLVVESSPDTLVIPYTGLGPTHLDPDVLGIEVGTIQAPETENHVLMIHTWMYLVNQWVASGKRGVPPLLGGTSMYQNANSQLETFVLAAVGRFLKNGAWETNARPYQALSVRALEVLASYADDPVRTGATNALDALAAKYAFQSLDGKRAPPMRRQYAHRADTGIYQNDYLEAIFGVLSGAVVYNTDRFCRANPNDPPPEPGAPGAWLCLTNGNLDGQWPFVYGLDSALSNYRLPKTIHDLMLHPDNHQTGFGIWSRMQDRYSEQHYQVATKPRYPLPDGFGQPDLNAEIAAGTLAIEPAQEFYFVTQDYLNIAGSRTEHYAGFDSGLSGFEQDQLPDETRYGTDFWRKPTALIGNLDLGYWTRPQGEAQETLVADGDLGVYKNFVYAASAGSDSKAVRIPDHWKRGPSVQIGDATFFVVDSTSTRSVFSAAVGAHAPYFIVVGELPGNPNEPTWPASWGTWELVPARLFADEQAVIARVQAANGGNIMSRESFYEYTLAVSGEKLTLNEQFPVDSRSPFQRIDGSIQAVSDSQLNETPAAMPLMDARQVDASYKFTGKSYACASGDGRMVISNPHLGKQLVIDSRDHIHPTNEEPDVPAGSPDPCSNGFVVDSAVVHGSGGGSGG